MFVCEKCGNSDPRYLGNRVGEVYCRRCLSFQGEKAHIHLIKPNEDLKEHLDFDLSEAQDNIANGIKDAFLSHQNVFVHAVCGAGKTELVYKAITSCLRLGQQVGFAVPRRDVVIELIPRIQKAFPSNSITAVYGGHTDKLEADIILLTTHQLFRYQHYFDLLIVDETDAFPYAGNETLLNFLEKSIRGNYVLMSATPLDEVINKIKKDKGRIFTLTKRFHGYPLVVPTVIIKPFFKEKAIISLLNRFKNHHKPCFIFEPTIENAEELYLNLKPYFKDIKLVHSKKEGKEKIIEDFKNNKFLFLVTTSILERGVTIKNLQVIVNHASHKYFDSNTLIQISGRVGRKIDAPLGEIYFITDKITPSINKCIEVIEENNKYVDM